MTVTGWLSSKLAPTEEVEAVLEMEDDHACDPGVHSVATDVKEETEEMIDEVELISAIIAEEKVIGLLIAEKTQKVAKMI